jgi:hypothetical protein
MRICADFPCNYRKHSDIIEKINARRSRIMAKQPIFDEGFKKNVSESCGKIKDKLSDTFLTEDGKLDTEKLGNTARDTFKKVEDGVKDGYHKISDPFVGEDGQLDREKVGSAVNSAYMRTGRFLATSMTRLAEKMADKFGVDEENQGYADSEYVSEEHFAEASPAQEDTPEAAAEPVEEVIIQVAPEAPEEE